MSGSDAPATVPALGRGGWIACAALFLATSAFHAKSTGFELLRWDDDHYVTDNPLVSQGLSLRGALAAFGPDARGSDGHYIPLTWLSHMLDVSLFGLAPWGHHLSNVLLHALNVALLFVLLAKTTGRRAAPALAALLFALHPLQVESVAWVAERKNLLSATFSLACMLAYAGYARAPSFGRRLAVLGWLVAALLSKSMVVTLPLLLLLLDAFPLRRWSLAALAPLRPLVLGTLPLLAVAAPFAFVTLHGFRSADILASADHLPLSARIANSVLSYAAYLGNTAWPLGWSVLYPQPYLPATGGVPPTGLELGGSALLLCAISALVVGSRRDYLLAGWGIFLVALLPVIGLVQIGRQGIADRYMYLPLIGLALALAFGAEELWERVGARPWARLARAPSLIAASTWLMFLGSVGWVQQDAWRNTLSLLSVSARANPGHFHLNVLLAQELVRAGRTGQAAEHLARAVAIDPRAVGARAQLAHALLSLGHSEGALRQLRAAVELEPSSAELLVNLGNAEAQLDRRAEAAASYRRALALDPGQHAARLGLANALAMSGDLDAAERELRRLLAAEPNHPAARRALARVLERRQPAAGAAP